MLDCQTELALLLKRAGQLDEATATATAEEKAKAKAARKYTRIMAAIEDSDGE